MQPGSGKYVLRRDTVPPREPSFRIDYRNELNAAQYEAVINTQGAVLVVAGAGTGKTRTLVYRVARLVELGNDPANILLLTFTRKAAQEMLRRASTLLDGRCDRVAGGTFHSFANILLRRYGRPLSIDPGFTILDRTDSEDAIHLLRSQLQLDRKERRFPRKHTIAAMFSMAINKSLPLSELIELEYAHLAEHLQDLVALAEEYKSYKAARQLLDYDDLLVRLHDLLADHAETRQRVSQRYRHIMVDEYQDTNLLQGEIVRLLASEHGNVMAVGDDAQSIYGFRGANFRNIMDFPKSFPGTRVIAIEENYRSTQPILDFTNTVIAGARERHEKNLFTARKTGMTPLLIAGENEHFQSRFVCQRILDLREEGVPLNDIAVLFRSSFHAFDLELELTRHDIPFVKRGGFKFMETAHIKDVIAHMRVLVNPQDTVSWHRILMLIEGIGPRSAEDILKHVLAGNAVEQLDSFPKRAYSTELHALAGLLRRMQAASTLPEQVVDETLRYYEPILKRIHSEDHPKRRRDLDHFAAMAARYQDLEQLLSDIALEPPSDSVGDTLATDPDEGLLTLSTIHSAKGLEWHAVFIIWAAEGRFPSMFNLDDEDIEEERRLMYVAATRAKTELYVTYPMQMFDRGFGFVMTKPSRFVDGLPTNILEPVSLVDESAREE